MTANVLAHDRTSISPDCVATVSDGEVFSTYVQPSNWWHVRTKDNRYGFMHVTRIKPR
jgi:hypothetical protein